ncbi:hypothetical protein [Streptomyces sp. SP18CS02]|uniref:hypothetical protein n=1 Tax=Streptomyces sp. SP18CS02 TaxID=3002531 RepID=UPI002E771B73|nr:hypothetical protein [Streptomyces sp. SP18CS02]MEE1755116.1 hypothetical protein [Streptomyces sp. SP18CS02]
MAGRRRAAAGAPARVLALVLTVLLGLCGGLGCTPPAATDDATEDGIAAALDRRAAAVLDRGTGPPADPADPAAREFANLADVPLDSWSYRVERVTRHGDRATVRAELGYRIAGHDSGQVTSGRRLELTERDGRWHVTADRPEEGAAQQLWEQGPVRVVRGENSLVLGVGQDRVRLAAIAAMADRAVPAVSAAWPERWAGRVLLLVPASLDAMGALLGAPAAGYRGIAAVTTGASGGGAGAPADRIVVNPEAYGTLGEPGQRVVLTHETAHVATRAHTTPATPLWLSEGFADWAAYRASGEEAAQAAPELREAVRSGAAPPGLPEDRDFAFNGDADALARAYEGGWLACELIAERWGEERLRAFYRAVGAHGARPGAVEKALHDVLSTTPDDFTARWREHLRARLG